MNAGWKFAVAAVAWAATVSFASELYHPASAEEGMTLRPDHMKGGLTRTQVEQTVLAAQKDGTLTWISRGYPPRYPLSAGPSLTKTRAQVEQELLEWKQQPVRGDGARRVPGTGWVEQGAP